MIRFDTAKYLSKGAVAFGLFSVYDVLIDGKDFSGYGMRDGATFALSTIAAEWAADLLSGVWNMDDRSVSGMLTRPLLNGIVYMYLYNYMIRPEYESVRDNTNNFVMASLSEVLLSYVSNPFISLFSNMNHY
jgi:hypothetical protein